MSEEDKAFINWFEQNKDYLGPVTEEDIERYNNLINKTASGVMEQLKKGKTLAELFTFREGQDCMIFKADEFTVSDEVIYIPDIELNEINIHSKMSEEEINKLPLYTGKDFLKECNGKEDAARLLFSWCDWQHPCITDIITELDEDGNVMF